MQAYFWVYFNNSFIRCVFIRMNSHLLIHFLLRFFHFFLPFTPSLSIFHSFLLFFFCFAVIISGTSQFRHTSTWQEFAWLDSGCRRLSKYLYISIQVENRLLETCFLTHFAQNLFLFLSICECYFSILTLANSIVLDGIH